MVVASAVDLAVLSNTVEHVKDDITDIKTVLGTMSTNLQGITRIEERQIGVVSAIERSETTHEDHDKRLSSIEKELPGLREMRSWVIKGVSVGVTALVLGISSLVGTVVYDRVVQKAPQQVVIVPQ